MMRTHKAFLEEIKDFLEENGAGPHFKACKEIFYKNIERIIEKKNNWWWTFNRSTRGTR